MSARQTSSQALKQDASLKGFSCLRVYVEASRGCWQTAALSEPACSRRKFGLPWQNGRPMRLRRVQCCRRLASVCLQRRERCRPGFAVEHPAVSARRAVYNVQTCLLAEEVGVRRRRNFSGVSIDRSLFGGFHGPRRASGDGGERLGDREIKVVAHQRRRRDARHDAFVA